MTMEATTQPTINLLDLPEEMIDKVLSYLPYDQIAKLRAVNQMFNTICSNKLNKGFDYVNQFQHRCFKAVKAKLPRRESERRHHPLARHIDILMAVETRLSLLSMTFSKYIDARQCCFIPGKVLDEGFKVLRIVSKCSNPVAPPGFPQYPILPRPHDFLQEYRDVSSMAMEHFDDKILPRIRESIRLENGSRLFCFKQKSDSTEVFYNARSMDVKYLRPYKVGCVTDAGGKVTDSSNLPGKEKTSTVTSNQQQFMQLARQQYAAGNPALCRLCTGMQVKYKSVHQSVAKLNRTFKLATRKLQEENVMLKTQMVRQKVAIKDLRRELRETRAAMNVMSKDLSQIKMDLQPSRGTKRKREDCDEDCD